MRWHAHDFVRRDMDTCRGLRRSGAFVDVDVMWGTGGTGHMHPGASVPFGMVQLSPSNGGDGWQYSSGYHSSSNRFIGMVHTALSGTGLPDFGDLLVVPGASTGRGGGRLDLSLKHPQECAVPGRYVLALSNVMIAATASEHVGVQRIMWKPRAAPHLIFDLGWGQGSTTIAHEVIRVGDGISGWRKSDGFGRVPGTGGTARARRTVYFSCAFHSRAAFEVLFEGTQAIVSWDVNSTQLAPFVVEVQCALSAVSVKGAEGNLRAEEGGFHEVAARATHTWQREFSRFSVNTELPMRRLLMSALYRTLLTPNLLSDADGAWPPAMPRLDDGIGRAYSTLGTWDTFRAASPWLSLFRPSVYTDVVRTMISWATGHRRLPKWLLWDRETNVMIAYHGVAIVADALIKRLVPPADIRAALTSINATTSDHYNEPVAQRHAAGERMPSADTAGGMPEAVSTGLEVAVDDACAARVLTRESMSHDRHASGTAARLAERGRMYSAYYDRARGYFLGTGAAVRYGPFAYHYAHRKANDFTEGSALQYLFTPALTDPDGLAALVGGPDKLAIRLESLFEPRRARADLNARDVTGCLNHSQYCHGNEPVHHAPYVFNSLGKPWRTQYWIDRILSPNANLYRTGPRGLPGNEDTGQLSAWLLFSALGFYPRDPCSGRYELGRPTVHRASLTLEGGGLLNIEVHNQRTEHPYVQRVMLNELELNQSYITHEELMRGAKLEFFMGAAPNYTLFNNEET
eukprot:CAMPEP_0119307128 /NCGR_PEP_ID=MMETSP1333-20130426/7704_1 /TAXON_ID=418940 /ORGANISM="Scyphosphaera apsteinii, Strain RCC1455" /LENGTH=744 /DNA_ID=CAMNT_0007310601 /DNA_START=194 /DNA_END=2431 /DNA_ORIENTATION=+